MSACVPVSALWHANHGCVQYSLDCSRAQSASGGGAYIVRLAAGNPDVYLRKARIWLPRCAALENVLTQCSRCPQELLWPHIREFADRTVEYVRAKQRELQEEHGQNVRVLCIHGHYADAAEARPCARVRAMPSSRLQLTRTLRADRLHDEQHAGHASGRHGSFSGSKQARKYLERRAIVMAVRLICRI